MKQFAVGLLLLMLTSRDVPRSAAAVATNAFAWPEISMIHGGSLKERVVIVGWKENMRLMSGLHPQRSVPDSALEGRPFFEVALFWGVNWANYSANADSIRNLQPHQGTQFARLYPAFGNAPPLYLTRFGLSGLPAQPYMRIDADALDMLARYGVRLRAGAAP